MQKRIQRNIQREKDRIKLQLYVSKSVIPLKAEIRSLNFLCQGKARRNLKEREKKNGKSLRLFFNGGISAILTRQTLRFGKRRIRLCFMKNQSRVV